MTSSVGQRDADKSPLVSGIFHVIEVGAQNKMSVAWQDLPANHIRSRLVIPDAAANIAGVHDDVAIRDGLPARLFPGEAVRELHSTLGHAELSVSAFPASSFAHDGANPEPAGIGDRDALSEALKDWPCVRLAYADIATKQRLAVAEGEEVAATVDADGRRDTLLRHQDHPPGEPRRVATLPGHSCVNCTTWQTFADAVEALKAIPLPPVDQPAPTIDWRSELKAMFARHDAELDDLMARQDAEKQDLLARVPA